LEYNIYQIPFAGFLILFGFARVYAGSWASVPVFVSGAYLLSAAATLGYTPAAESEFQMNHRPAMILHFLLINFIWILPSFFAVKPKPVDFLLRPASRALIISFCIIGWIALLYQLPYAIKSVSQGARITRTDLNQAGIAPLPDSPLTTLAAGFSMFYPIYSLAMMSALAKKRSLFYSVSCAAGVLSYLVNGLSFTARDTFIWLSLMLVFSFWVYNDVLPRKILLKARTAVVLACLSGILGLTAFTMQRFGDRGAISSVFAYLGQQPYVFAETVAEQTEFYGLSLRFPLLARIFNSYDQIVRTVPYEWSFGGFSRDIYSIAGFPTAYGISLAASMALSFGFLYLPKIGRVAYLLLLCLYLQFMVHGVFYFRLGLVSGNQYHLIMLIIILVLHIDEKLHSRSQKMHLNPQEYRRG
jgi:hypothetical protein